MRSQKNFFKYRLQKGPSERLGGFQHSQRPKCNHIFSRSSWNFIRKFHRDIAAMATAVLIEGQEVRMWSAKNTHQDLDQALGIGSNANR